MKLQSERTKRVEIPKDEDGGFIVIRNLSMEEVSQIESKYFQISSEGVSLRDLASKTADFARACLKDWGNLFDHDGSVLNFNASNLEKVSNASFIIDGKRTRFFEWVDIEREKFSEEVELEEAQAVKN